MKERNTLFTPEELMNAAQHYIEADGKVTEVDKKSAFFLKGID